MNERLIPLFKEEGIKKLQNATVAVVGVGGVGGICAITLARSGVGNIIIQDFDIVEESNINRQIVANYNTIGLSKVDVLYNQIKEINPNCNVIKLNSFFDKDNLSLFSYNIDYVIDAIDSFDSKCFLIENCINRNIKFISSMGAAKKIDPSKVEITKLQKTSYDPWIEWSVCGNSAAAGRERGVCHKHACQQGRRRHRGQVGMKTFL